MIRVAALTDWLDNNKSVSNAILKGPDMCKQQGNQWKNKNPIERIQ